MGFQNDFRYLGKGEYSRVYLAKREGSQFAVKAIYRQSERFKNDPQSLSEHEFYMMEKAKNFPFILQ